MHFFDFATCCRCSCGPSYAWYCGPIPVPNVSKSIEKCPKVQRKLITACSLLRCLVNGTVTAAWWSRFGIVDVSKHGPDEVFPQVRISLRSLSQTSPCLPTVQPHQGAKESLGNCCSFAGFARGGCELIESQ